MRACGEASGDASFAHVNDAGSYAPPAVLASDARSARTTRTLSSRTSARRGSLQSGRCGASLRSAAHERPRGS